MKKIISFCLLAWLLVFKAELSAQYVTIPDTIFVNWLVSHGFAGCINGQQLDTTCSAVINATSLSPAAVPIRDLTGIQYFKNLDTLDCSNDALHTIPALPANLTYLGCSINHLSSLPALPTGLGTLLCANNQLSALPVLPANLGILECGLNQLSTLPALSTNLTYLDCSGNPIGSFPALPGNLQTLYCAGNHLSTLPALPANLTALDCGNGQISTMPVLPTNLVSLYCNNNQLSSLPALPDSLLYFACDGNQLSTLPPLPSNLENLICGGNLLNTLPTLPANLTWLVCTNNQVNTLPALPAALTDLECDNNQLSSLPALPANLTRLNCSFNQLSTLPALPDYMYSLNCSYNPYLTCLPELKKIRYFYFDSTAITCLPDYGIVDSSSPLLSSIPLCGIFNPYGCQTLWNISGRCFYDRNNDCVFDSTDAGTNYVKTQLYGNGTLVQQTFSGGEGFYSFDSVVYGPYTLSIDTSNLPFIVECPASGYYTDTLSATDTLIYNNNFAFKCRTTGFDIGVQSVLNNYMIPRPNAVFELNTIAGDMSQLYGANCAAGISGQVLISYSGQISYTGPAPGALSPTSVTGNTITWTIADYGAVNVYSAFNLLFKVDSLATPGTQACFTVSVTPLTGDYNPGNNTLNYCFTIVNALDPNEKEVYPTHIDSAGQRLTYTIRFQNTGTAPAVNIRITDTLDNNLDPSTFQLLTFSAKNLTQIFGPVAVFNFPNINLPDSAQSDSASRGYVQYCIKTKAGMAPGDAASNTANIYFDLNPAVVTNTVTDIFTRATGMANVNGAFTFSIYPNPANTTLYIKTGDVLPEQLRLYTITGSLIYQGKFEPQVNLSNLSPGTYLIELKAGKQTARKMFVKM